MYICMALGGAIDTITATMNASCKSSHEEPVSVTSEPHICEGSTCGVDAAQVELEPGRNSLTQFSGLSAS